MKHRIYVPLIFLSLFIVGILTGAGSRPEASSATGYLASGGPMGYFANGTAMLPSSVQTAAVNGNLTPAYQFSMGQHMLNEAAEAEINAYYGTARPNGDPISPPQRRGAFKTNQQKSFQTQCRASRVFIQAVLQMYLPMLSLKPANGGNVSKEQQQEEAAKALTIAQQAKPSEKCASAGLGGGGIDPNLLMIFAQLH